MFDRAHGRNLANALYTVTYRVWFEFVPGGQRRRHGGRGTVLL